MTTAQILIVVLFIGIGGFSLAGSIMNWNFFMESRKAAFMVRIMGRTGARILYGLLGAGLIGFAIYGCLHPEILHSKRYGI